MTTRIMTTSAAHSACVRRAFGRTPPARSAAHHGPKARSAAHHGPKARSAAHHGPKALIMCQRCASYVRNESLMMRLIIANDARQTLFRTVVRGGTRRWCAAERTRNALGETPYPGLVVLVSLSSRLAV